MCVCCVQVDSKVKSETAKPPIEKRPFEKVKCKLEIVDVPVVEKKMKLPPDGRSRSLSCSPDPTSKPLVLPLAAGQRMEQEDSEATDIEEDGGEESFALEGMGAFGDLACVVCKNMDYKPGNQLVECQECHSLYHQSCHKPPATDPDVLDPRTIWNCSKCTKNMKKCSVKLAKCSSAKSPTTASSAFQVAVNIGKESALQLVKERSMKQQQPETPTTPTAQPFRRSEPAKAGSGPGAGTAKPIGLAGLAANLNNKAGIVSSGSGLTSAAQVAGAAADRRLQMMKKKAAKANEKKRSGSK